MTFKELNECYENADRRDDKATSDFEAGAWEFWPWVKYLVNDMKVVKERLGHKIFVEGEYSEAEWMEWSHVERWLRRIGANGERS